MRPSSGLRAPSRGPLGSRAIAGSSEQRDIFERRLLLFLEIEAEPAGGEAAVAVRLLPRHQCRQLERLGDRHPADLSCGHLGQDEVAAFQRPPEDRSRVALRGRLCSSPGPRRQRAPSAASPALGGAHTSARGSTLSLSATYGTRMLKATLSLAAPVKSYVWTSYLVVPQSSVLPN